MCTFRPRVNPITCGAHSRILPGCLNTVLWKQVHSALKQGHQELPGRCALLLLSPVLHWTRCRGTHLYKAGARTHLYRDGACTCTEQGLAHTCTGKGLTPVQGRGSHTPVQGWVSLEHFHAHVLLHKAVQENREGSEADVVEGQIRSIIQSLQEGEAI